VQNIFSSSFKFQNIKIKIYRTIILTVVLYAYETWSLILREEPRLRMFENRVLRRIFGPKREWKNYLRGSFMICTPQQILFGRSNCEERDKRGM